jgi:hypothetical protein
VIQGYDVYVQILIFYQGLIIISLFSTISRTLSILMIKDTPYSVHFLNHSRMMLVASASLQVNKDLVSPFAKELGQSCSKFV